MPVHTKAKRAKNRSQALTKLRKKTGGQFTEKEGAAAVKAANKRGRKTVSGLARNAAASNASRRARRRKR